ncbi:unnamed protein product [Prunus armeniaca]
MPTEDSHDAQRNTPQEGTSQRGPSAEVNLQAEVELLHANVVKMSESVTGKGTKPRAPNTALPERTHPNQPEHSHHSPPIQPRPSNGKGPLHPEMTKSRLLRISPPRNRPHEPTKVYGIAGIVSWTVRRDPFLSPLISKTQR